MLCYFQQFPFQIRENTVVDDFTTVFGRDDNMIIAKVYMVVVILVCRHQAILTRRQGCGYILHPRAYSRGLRWKTKPFLFFTKMKYISNESQC